MKPPIRIQVRTNNLNTCTLLISGTEERANGIHRAIDIPSDGNVYSGLHRVGPEIEKLMNDVLAAHGIVSTEPEPDGVDAAGNPTWQGEPHPPPAELVEANAAPAETPAAETPAETPAAKKTKK